MCRYSNYTISSLLAVTTQKLQDSGCVQFLKSRIQALSNLSFSMFLTFKT